MESIDPDRRAEVLPLIRDSFTGYYRWHATRSLRDAATVRALRRHGQLLGFSILEWLEPTVGYVGVSRVERRTGVGGKLVDDALRGFAKEGVEIVFAAVERTNRPSIALLESRGFRATDPKERNWKEGGLGAWGLRSRMHVVSGEVVYARRIGGTGSPSERTRSRRAVDRRRPLAAGRASP